MPPCLDLYVWIEPSRRDEAVKQFLRHYVDAEKPGDPRFDAFVRVFVTQSAAAEDHMALAELRRDDAAGDEFSLYVQARKHHQAILTITRERAAVLGLSLDDPYYSRGTGWRGRLLLRRLRREFSAPAGIAGAELPPPQSRLEWTEAWPVAFRSGRPSP